MEQAQGRWKNLRIHSYPSQQERPSRRTFSAPFQVAALAPHSLEPKLAWKVVLRPWVRWHQAVTEPYWLASRWAGLAFCLEGVEYWGLACRHILLDQEQAVSPVVPGDSAKV